MNEFSVLVGGRAGDGINEAGILIARIFNQLGYHLFQYYDYPSLVRGGHNFSIVRASKKKIGAHCDNVDFILALNQDTIDRHEERLKEGGLLICDSVEVKSDVPKSIGFPLKEIVEEADAPLVARNTCLIGAFCKAAGINWDVLEIVLRKEIPKEIEANLKVARKGYDEAEEQVKAEMFDHPCCPVITGNEIVGLGLLRGDLDAYVAYPMTPSSGVLHSLAGYADNFSIKVVHPENEIAAILMALGFAYAGKMVATGTSGGGFCLMNEGFSLAGMAELPIVVVMAQRPGPSTGVPTYTTQSDLHFVMNAGQGEFTRLVIAPGDAEQTYFWAAFALKLAWEYQAQVVLLTDKALGESAYNLDLDQVEVMAKADPALWSNEGSYNRYATSETGVSPMAFPPQKGQAIKVNSYAHLESGITTEDPVVVTKNQDKLLLKEKSLIAGLKKYPTVNVYGNAQARTALLCWGSNKGVCAELGEKLGLRVVQPVVLNPFPAEKFQEAIKGAEKVISVENNSTGQLARLVQGRGFSVDETILKYDGRPFSVEDLDQKLKVVTI